MKPVTDQRPAISVIMPVFNGAATLGRALGSLLAQSFPRWELVAVDDGSDDDGFEQLRRAGAADQRLRPHRLAANRGPSAARNHALGQARGEVVTYLDCDDEYYPGYLERVWGDRAQADVLVFGYDLIEERPGLLGDVPVRTWNPAAVQDRLLMENIVIPLGVAHRRDLLDRVGLFDEALSFQEDWDLWMRMARAWASFLFVPSKSGRYHVRPDSQSRRYQAQRGSSGG